MTQKKIKIAAIFSAKKEIGGGYSQGLEDLRWFSGVASKAGVELIVLTFNRKTCDDLRSKGVASTYFRMNFLDKVLNEVYCKINIPQLAIAFRKLLSFSLMDARLKNDSVDLVYFGTHNRAAIYLFETNFIMTVMDICHIDNPWAPEVRKNKRFERREELNVRAGARAFAMIFESKSGKDNFVNIYSVRDDKCFVIPFHVKNVCLSNANKLIAQSVPGDYIFYPAQYWPHKNHAYIIEALAVLRRKSKIDMRAIFCGSDPEKNKNYLKEMAVELGVIDLVDFMGFVTDEELSQLYSNAFAVVMTTYFGPTNLPPIEAMQHGKPILYSSIPGAIEQLGQAALYLNLSDPGDLAEKIEHLHTSSKDYDELVNVGKGRLQEIIALERDAVLVNIIKSFARVRCTWR